MKLIKPQITHIVTQTTQGEITVNLNLTITLNSDGTLGVSAKSEKPEADKTQFTIPEFEATESLIDFHDNPAGG